MISVTRCPYCEGAMSQEMNRDVAYCLKCDREVSGKDIILWRKLKEVVHGRNPYLGLIKKAGKR